MNVIFGASGFAKEVNFLLSDNDPSYSTDFYVGKDESVISLSGVDVISEKTFFDRIYNIPNSKLINIYIGIGSPFIRSRVYNTIGGVSNFPNAVHKSVIFDKNLGGISIGIGNIICPVVALTTSISIGNHNHINLGCTIGHDTTIGDFNTFSPGVHVSGNVLIGNNVFIGTGAVLLENIQIAENVVIGAGSVVTKDIVESGTYVGIPAKRIK